MLKRLKKWLVWAPWLSCIGLLALLQPLLTNSKPVACKYQGNWYFPAWHDYTTGHGLYRTIHPLRQFALNASWPANEFEYFVPALIPFHPTDRDTNSPKVRPGTNGHLLGTDATGHDVAAGLISGARIALTISLLAVLAAAILGIGIGAIAGYFGDQQLRIARWHLVISLPVLLIFTVILYTVEHEKLTAQNQTWQWVLFWLVGSICIFLLSAFGKFLFTSSAWLQRGVVIPIDLITQRLGEITSAFPKLIVLTVMAALLNQNPSIYFIALIAGAFSWPSIASYVRAEMLKVRSMNYIAAARMLGLSELKVLIKHALPNALAPAWVALSFFAGSAILLETSLSFLGIRDASESISWGSLMLDARLYPTAWWLAVFPGLMITITIYTLYRIAMQQSNKHTPLA
jgi:peptide/nickel transport system permease protein